MNADVVTYYALDRDRNLSGVSGPGRVAYAVELAILAQRWEVTPRP